MGSEHSQLREPRPPKSSTVNESGTDDGFVRIERAEMPEEYRVVRLSENALQRLMQIGPNPRNDEQTKELKKQKEHKSSAHNSQEAEIEEKRRIFEETAKRIEKEFINMPWSDACSGEQKEIISCLDKFPGQILNCQAHLDIYRKCIDKVRTKFIDQT